MWRASGGDTAFAAVYGRALISGSEVTDPDEPLIKDAIATSKNIISVPLSVSVGGVGTSIDIPISETGSDKTVWKPRSILSTKISTDEGIVHSPNSEFVFTRNASVVGAYKVSSGEDSFARASMRVSVVVLPPDSESENASSLLWKPAILKTCN
ncbi:MAG: hypothetical protein JJT75_03090 [Opitutales bacterium]|nr:hypothetical protein [Opitutales bacterium]